MAYVDPPDATPAGTASSTDYNILTDDVRYLKAITDGVTASIVQLHKSSSQSISNATDTLSTFQVEDLDFGGWWSSGTNIVVPASAVPAPFTTIIVDVIIRTRWATNGTGNRTTRSLLNGTMFGSTTDGGISGDPTEQYVIEAVEVAVGDVITAQVYQTSGGALNLDVCNITVKRYAPAS